jgi:hypothetical protein
MLPRLMERKFHLQNLTSLHHLLMKWLLNYLVMKRYNGKKLCRVNLSLIYIWYRIHL